MEPLLSRMLETLPQPQREEAEAAFLAILNAAVKEAVDAAFPPITVVPVPTCQRPHRYCDECGEPVESLQRWGHEGRTGHRSCLERGA